MRHLTLEELLSLQEGEELGDLTRHAEQCPLCAAERRALQLRQEALRSLPILQPSKDQWPAIRARIVASKRRRALAFAGALVAAAVLAFALFSPALLRPRAPAVDNSVDEVAELVRQSQRLEEQLRSLPEPEVLDLGSAETIVQLEDQIALVDECIEELGSDSGVSEELAVLWETRITLLESLTNLRSPAFAQLLR